ncbi:MAG: hypothetical protein IJB31_04610 [Akkermansia sp.]|nr:hypothetical protein [Akkermansia sp.]
MQRRYRPNRKTTSHAIPLTAIGLTAAALILWGIYAKGDDIVHFFKGETIIVADNTEANDNLALLLQDLSGDKSKLLELAENSKARLGWIRNEATKRQFRWFLMSRLVDKEQWEEAVRILPEVESLAPVEGLERLAIAALKHGDHELQLRLDRQLQAKVIDMPDQTALLLRSIRRTVETCLKMHKTDDAVQAISQLDRAAVLARLADPALAADAAALQMMRADVSAVKEPVLQMVRNILEQARWPLCPATSRLILEEVSNTLRDHPNLSQQALKEVETKLLRCRDSMLENPDKEHRLPQCYSMLGELRFRLADYEGCAQALSLAAAFAEGYGEMTPELQIKLSRIRSRANEARGAVSDTMEDCRYLLENDSDKAEQLRCLTYLATHSEGAEKIELLMRCWDRIKENPKLVGKDSPIDLPLIAKELSVYYAEKEDYKTAIKWVQETLSMVEAAHPNLTDGKTLRARVNLALVRRKAKEDLAAVRILRDVVRAIESMSDEDRAKLDAADAKLYKDAVREFSRTYLVAGDKKLAQAVIKKIKESLPAKER